ncbi:hypothetical protein GGS26DRAFT_272011 [Hypomontagnella submonticulosa]|nr:hypothetical protein GGS26DRAFT_272011 [Hypomontagnella submonticulosa]
MAERTSPPGRRDASPPVGVHRSESSSSKESRLIGQHNFSGPVVSRGSGRYNFLAVPNHIASRQNSLDSDSVTGSTSVENHKLVPEEDSLGAGNLNADVEFAKSFKLRWEAASKVFRFLRRWKFKTPKTPPPTTLTNRDLETPGSPEQAHTAYPPRRRDRSRSRPNSALGAPTVMAGIVAGSIAAGWSPIERSGPPIESPDSLRPQLSLNMSWKDQDLQLGLTPNSQPAEHSALEHSEGVAHAGGRSPTQANDYEGTVVSSPVDANIDLPNPEAAHDNPPTESGTVEELPPTHVDADYPSEFIYSSGEGVYFSTKHHEVTDPVLFRKARTTLDRLQPDLDPIIGKLRRGYTIGLATLELRMAGQILEGTSQVRLLPSVWILCRDRSACKIIQRRLNELSWLESPKYSTVYVRAGLHLAASGMPRAIKDLDLNHGVTFWSNTGDSRLKRQIYVHMEDSEDMFACGTRCCITMTKNNSHDVVYQRICRIGGYLLVDLPSGPQVVAVTTAHGLLQPWIDHHTFDDTAGIVTAMEVSNPDGEYATSCSNHSSESIGIQGANQPNGAGLGLATQWRPMNLFPDTVSFAFQAIPDTKGVFEIKRDTVSADFLLLSVGSLPSPNLYFDTFMDAASKGTRRHLTDASLSSSINPGVIAGLEPNVITKVDILPDVVPLLVNGIKLPTRKLRLHVPKPLGQGASGSWVVQGDALCGIIIAAFQEQPFALMLTAEKLFSDIEKFCSKISSVKVATRLDYISDVQSTASDVTANGSQLHAVQYAQINTTQRRAIRKRGISTSGDRDSIRDSISQADEWLAALPLFSTRMQILSDEDIRRPHFDSKHKAIAAFHRTRVLYRFAHNSKAWIRKALHARRDDVTERSPQEGNHSEDAIFNDDGSIN